MESCCDLTHEQLAALICDIKILKGLRGSARPLLIGSFEDLVAAGVIPELDATNEYISVAEYRRRASLQETKQLRQSKKQQRKEEQRQMIKFQQSRGLLLDRQIED